MNQLQAGDLAFLGFLQRREGESDDGWDRPPPQPSKRPRRNPEEFPVYVAMPDPDMEQLIEYYDELDELLQMNPTVEEFQRWCQDHRFNPERGSFMRKDNMDAIPEPQNHFFKGEVFATYLLKLDFDDLWNSVALYMLPDGVLRQQVRHAIHRNNLHALNKLILHCIHNRPDELEDLHLILTANFMNSYKGPEHHEMIHYLLAFAMRRLRVEWVCDPHLLEFRPHQPKNTRAFIEYIQEPPHKDSRLNYNGGKPLCIEGKLVWNDAETGLRML